MVKAMREASAQSYDAHVHPDARKFVRSKVDFCGVLLDRKGAALSDCTIKNLSAVGAQVLLPNSQSIPENLYLLDITNDLAYEARIAWWRPHRAGLAFQTEYPLGDTVPQHLAFLNRAALNAKMAREQPQSTRGGSRSDGIESVGAIENSSAHPTPVNHPELNLTEIVSRLEAENASLRRMLLEQLKKSQDEQ